MKHTTEPWMAWKDGSDRDLFGPATNYTAGQCFHTPDIDACEANARRIVACVNACAGVTTEELEQGGFVAGLVERLEDAPRWRDVVDELPQEAQEVLFVRGGKTVHGAWIGGIFWYSNQKMAAATWMPLPKPPKVGAGDTAALGHNVELTGAGTASALNAKLGAAGPGED